MSSIVVLVILAILILGWLPRRTADSMNRVVEHREDKYSPSLHLVDARSGTRFCDDRQPLSEGVLMRSEQTNIVTGSSARSIAGPAKAGKERAKVAHIRKLRREAAHRRAIISASLLVVTLLVFGISFPLKFSPLFALIPAVLLAVVVALGIRTANHARAWERNLKAKRQTAAKAQKSGSRPAKQNNVAVRDAAQALVSVDEQPTGMMAEHEIEQALRETKAEKERIERQRARNQQTKDRKDSQKGASRQAADVGVTSSSKKAAPSSSPAKTKQRKLQAASPSVNKSQQSKEGQDAPKSVKPVKQASQASKSRKHTSPADSLPVQHAAASKTQPQEPSDATHELKQVHPAPALDVVDLASNQDLISFSLGAPRNGVEVKSEEPKSLEIKSTRQVAKAKATAKPEDASENRKSAKKSRKRAKVATKKNGKTNDDSRAYASDPEEFHASELSADAEAPAVSSDSLGTGLEKILERRNV
ncbi:hypothetical protein OZX73_07190 [Bifidobacterium sp. ESL0775]|uniref:hypothetical protein n=1 Tax=Bifidobacterium sp. ESL0775 TaxID=2983230 RepID=UPI0023F731DD|nr:hypothetical protein [Bifidobacterium sp. ESL0775]WEV69039.1 hypothetical protein OZX73_07190 [Bifidobacterium sp. ESL0775]